MRRIVHGLLVLALFGTGCLSAVTRREDLRRPCPGFWQGHRRNSGWNCMLEPSVIGAYTVSMPEPCPAGGCVLKAGFKKVDITPPPGFPMGGNGYIAQFGRGYWTRLSARAFFFRDTKGQSLAFVSCDLGSMAGALPGVVLRKLYKREKDSGKPGLNLSLENLILAATHVHQGPGNFQSFKLYNDVGSPAPGFDATLFDWLAERIADAIEGAACDAEDPSTRETELVFKEGEVTDFLRNRAPEPFMLNSDWKQVLAAGPHCQCHPDSDPFVKDPYVKDCPRYNAVDGRIAVLEIHRTSRGSADSRHVGSMVFLSVHPEALSSETQLYQSDFTGLAMSLLERRDKARKFVAGFFNGADGDISLRWNQRNRVEAVGFANKLVDVIDHGLSVRFKTDAPEFLVGRSEIPSNCYFILPRQVYKPYCNSGMCLADTPMYGAATLGGSEDARSPLFDLGWKPGVRTEPWDNQGVKQEGLKARFLPINLTSLMERSCLFPETMPVSFVRLKGKFGRLDFGVVPGELTRTAWWRIERMFDPDPNMPRDILPIGLANEYIGYVTTREEYAAQGYEGASTIFGPYSADLILLKLAELSNELHRPVKKTVNIDEREFYPGDEDSFGPERQELQATHADADEALENLIVDEYGRPNRHWPRFEWHECRINDWKAGRTVEVLREGETSAVWDDESGGNILTVSVNPEYRKADGSRSRETPGLLQKLKRGYGTKESPEDRRWIAIWLTPLCANPDDPFYFRVTLHDKAQTQIVSKPFTLKDVEGWQPPRAVDVVRCSP
jgi:neutral ceramidase